MIAPKGSDLLTRSTSGSSSDANDAERGVPAADGDAVAVGDTEGDANDVGNNTGYPLSAARGDGEAAERGEDSVSFLWCSLCGERVAAALTVLEWMRHEFRISARCCP